MKLTLLLLLAALLPKAKVPFVVADGNGGFYVSHVAANGALQVARIRDGKWSPAHTIASTIPGDASPRRVWASSSIVVTLADLA